jgi:hypothetical protein
VKSREIDQASTAAAMRAAVIKDICLSLGLAALVTTLTSVMGSM